MKELSIEAKAKRYDEALIRGSRLWESDMITRENYEYIFPEVKESEDESEDDKDKKIQETICNCIKWFCSNHKLFKDIGQDKCLAWFEKHCNPQVRTGLEWVNTIDDACDKRYSEEYAHGEYCHEQSFKWGFQEGVAWLEKQGEQKLADKVEPKFEIGDWVVWDNKVSCHIDNIYQGKNSLMYTITDTNNMTRSYSVKCFDSNAHLWTIQDAKDGDVLVASDGSIFLFKGTTDCACIHYVALTTDDVVKFNECLEHYWEISTEVHPATKEQRDLLFQKMKEAGYEWDVEKKYVKKIYLNPVWSKEDEENLNWFEKFFRAESVIAGGRDIPQDKYLWLKSLKDRYTWKPSDEQMADL